MSMIFKSILTGVVSTVSAAGVVWFGTAPDAHDHPHDHPHGPTAKMESDVKAVSPGVQPRTLVVERGDAPATTQTRVKDEEPQRRWIDKFMNRGDGSDADRAEIKVRDDMPEHLEKRERNMGGRLGSEELKAAKREQAEKDAAARKANRIVEEMLEKEAEAVEIEHYNMRKSDERDARSERKDAKVERKDAKNERKDVRVMVRERLDDTDIETGKGEMSWKQRAGKDGEIIRGKVILRMADDADVDVMAFETEGAMADDELEAMISRVIRDAELPRRKTTSGDAMRTYEKADPGRLLATTEAIDDANLRDQALYAVSTYALRFDDFETADDAVSRMGDDNLRDTAMSKVAIRYGEIGQIDRAMDVIGGLENEELQDIIRVQLVEVLTTPLEERNKRPDY